MRLRESNNAEEWNPTCNSMDSCLYLHKVRKNPPLFDKVAVGYRWVMSEGHCLTPIFFPGINEYHYRWDLLLVSENPNLDQF